MPFLFRNPEHPTVLDSPLLTEDSDSTNDGKNDYLPDGNTNDVGCKLSVLLRWVQEGIG
jgi:hypothetical protein